MPKKEPETKNCLNLATFRTNTSATFKIRASCLKSVDARLKELGSIESQLQALKTVKKPDAQKNSLYSRFFSSNSKSKAQLTSRKEALLEEIFKAAETASNQLQSKHYSKRDYNRITGALLDVQAVVNDQLDNKFSADLQL